MRIIGLLRENNQINEKRASNGSRLQRATNTVCDLILLIVDTLYVARVRRAIGETILRKRPMRISA